MIHILTISGFSVSVPLPHNACEEVLIDSIAKGMTVPVPLQPSSVGYVAVFLWTYCLEAAGHTECTVKTCQCVVSVLLLTKEDEEGALWVDGLHTSHDTHGLLTS